MKVCLKQKGICYQGMDQIFKASPINQDNKKEFLINQLNKEEGIKCY